MKNNWVLLTIIVSFIAIGCSGKTEVSDAEYAVINNPEYGEFQDYETSPFQFELILN